ncbi:S24 family peptidase [Hydrogenimonas urashimensis]|uniref:S24 family peptidase n=1 Tax=Hydrogenimonas urashimensis TaxID=2740515 RepID=UPI00191591C8|nr:S24 family peptidase [Hydrogenimonas urashimensis]
MLSFDEVVGRLKDILSSEVGERRVLDKDVAETLGIAPAYFAVLKKRGSIPFAPIADFCAKRKISINWLLYDQAPRSLEENTEKVATIRYFRQINASAGNGAINWEESYETIAIDEALVRLLGGRKYLKNIDALEVRGDSMEPLLHDGDLIAVDRSRQRVRNGGIYVLRIGEELFIKQVRQKERDGLACVSLNPAYPVIYAEASEIQIIGEAVAIMQRGS